MKKLQRRKLTLAKHTLVNLAAPALSAAIGGVVTANVSGCIHCPPTKPETRCC